MENFFFDFNFEKSRENGRICYSNLDNSRFSKEAQTYTLETNDKLSASKRLEYLDKKTGAITETQEEIRKLENPQKAKETENKLVKKTANAGKESTKESFETDNKFGDKKEVEGILKEFSEKFVEENKIPQKFEEEVLRNKKYQSPEEFAETSREFMDKYSDSYLKYIEKSATEHPYLASHFHLIPNDLENTGKISTALFSLGFIGNEGGMKDSLMRGGRWALWGAVLTHPVVTGALAHSLSWAVPKVTKIVGTGLGAFIDFIYNPGKTSREFYDRLKKGENPFVEDGVERTSKMLKSTTDPLFLRAQGMQFSSDLNTVLDGINRLDKAKSSEEKEKILEKIRPQAVQFLAQTANLAKGISHEDIVEMGRKTWENDPNNPPQDKDYRLILMWKSREKIKEVFANDKSFDDEVAHKLQSIKNNLSGADKNKLKELGVEDLDKVIAVGGKNFAKITAEKKHGIRRALSNMSGTALITYILMFLLTKGVMGIKGLFQADTYKKAFSKENIKKRAGQVWDGITFLPKKAANIALYPLGQSNSQRARRAVLKWGKNGYATGVPKWNSDQIKAWKSLSNDEKSSVAKKLREIVSNKEKSFADKLKNIKQAAKDKKSSKWKIWKALDNRKVTKEMKNSEEYKEAIKGMKNPTVSKEEWKNLFSGINEKVYKVLFPSD